MSSTTNKEEQAPEKKEPVTEKKEQASEKKEKTPEKKEQAPKKSNKKVIITAIIVAMLIIAALLLGIVYMVKGPGFLFGSGEVAEPETEVTQSAPEEALADTETTKGSAEPASLDEIMDAASSADDNTDNPDGWYASFESSGAEDRDIDLASYTAKCPDVYAWIDIPGTDIDYPIAYCKDASEPFYFTHDIDGNPSDKGMIITDSLNGKDFSDRVTLIYGHDADDGTMFAPLHKFRDAKFFEGNDRINIYLKDVQLVYKIYACYIGSSDHLLANYDFNDPVSFAEYYDSISGVRDLSINIREDVKPSFYDHVIVLITHCGDDSKRLFVQAVLDEVRYR